MSINIYVLRCEMFVYIQVCMYIFKPNIKKHLMTKCKLLSCCINFKFINYVIICLISYIDVIKIICTYLYPCFLFTTPKMLFYEDENILGWYRQEPPQTFLKKKQFHLLIHWFILLDQVVMFSPPMYTLMKNNVHPKTYNIH